MKTIIDLLFLAILVVCIWNGYKKGLIMGIGGILAIIVAIYCGNLLSNTFSYEAVPALRPFAGGYLDDKLTNSVYDLMGYKADEDGNYHVELSAADLIEQNPELREQFCIETYTRLGMYPSTAEAMAREAVEYADTNGRTLTYAVTEVACLKLCYAIGFLLAFLLVLIVLTVIGNLTNLSFKIPYVGVLNDITGVILGIVTGIALCAVAAWALKFMGILIPENVLADTKIASRFMEKDYLFRYLGL